MPARGFCDAADVLSGQRPVAARAVHLRDAEHAIPSGSAEGRRSTAAGGLLCEDGRPILLAGDNEAEAKRMLQAIQKYKFDNLCVMGSEEKGLRFLVRER